MTGGKLHKFVLTLFFCVGLGFLAPAQSHFLYIQSQNGTPFYVKMNDSLLSSTQAGYLILPQLQKGTYPIIIGFAKRKVPEAAFKIDIGSAGDKGFLLEEANSKLILKDIQSKKIIKPEEVATSAGNRILTSTRPTIANNQEEEPQNIDSLLAVQPSGAKPSQKEEGKPEANLNKEETENPFETMLNAVTGGGSETNTPPKSKKEPAEEIEQKKAEPEQEAATEQEEKEPEKETKRKLSFSDLINPSKEEQPNNLPQDENKNEEVQEPPSVEEPTLQTPKPETQDLTFIQFKNENDSGIQKDTQLLPGGNEEDTLITTTKELRQQEKEKRREEKQKNRENKPTLFERLIAQTNDHSTDSTAKPSIAKPLFSTSTPDSGTRAREDQKFIAGSEGTISCSSPADKDQFTKIRRKIASKKSEESMLRSARRYFSGETCYSTKQIKELVYLFGSDDYKLQFLKAAYPYCSDKDQYGSLTGTLNNPGYQKELEAFIR